MEACRNVLYSKLVNIKLDLKPMRLHEGDFYSNCYAAYLKLRVELGEYTKQRLKYTPFYRIVKRRIENETVAQCQEINAMAEFFHRSERETKLILCSFLFNVVNWTMYQKCMYNINQHYDDEVVRFWVLQMGIMLNSKLTSDSVTSNIGTPTNRKIDFQLYEKLNQMQMLNEFCGMLEDYSSIKYYDCPLLNALLLEVSNEGDSFGINEQSWFETLTCKCTLLFFSKSVVITLVNFLLQQEQEHYNEQKALKAAELKEKSVNVEKVVDPLEEISFILPNTIKYRETMQLKDEVKETTSKESTLSKKKGKIAKKTIIPGKSFVSESRVSKGSSKTQTSARTPTSMPEKPPAPKLFFVEEGSYTDKLRGFDKTFVSTDGIKVEYSKYDYDDYKTVRVKLLENRFVMHMVDDANFGFHFTLENGTIVNFVKPTDQLIKKYMQTQKLYTLTSSYRTDANRLGAPIKMENTFLISEDLVDRLHCKKRRAARKSIVETRLAAKMAAAQTIHKAQPMNSVESKTSVSLLFSSLKPKEPLGDEDDNREMKLLELTSKSQALRHLHYAQRVGVPIFKICSSKLHRFRYIKRLRSHVKINIADAVHAVMDKRKMSPKKTYVVRDIAASVDNEDVTCEDDYLITITLPSTLTIRSETDVLGRSQFRQFYHVMGPQCRDVSHEVSRTLTACGDLAVKYANGTMRLMCISGDVLHFKNPRFENRHMMSARCCRKYSPGKSYRRALRRLIARQHCHLNTRYCLNSSRKALSAREYIYMSPRSTIIAKRRRFPFPDYSIMKINGRRLRFHGGKVISKQMYYPMLTDNFALGTQKVSREDGTTVEINVRGEMVTTFLDGTQLRNRFEVETEQLVLDIFGEEMDPWLVITLYHEFRHPNYATVTCGGRNKKCILEIPGGGRIIKHDHQIEFEIQSGIGAVIDRSRVGLKVNMCPSCKLGASATIHIEDLYCGNQVDDIHYFIQCTDSFNKHLKVTYNGDFVPNEGYKCDLNYAKCKEHFMWHLPKFYAVNKDMSGTRFWTTNDYNNRNILAKRNNEVVSISSDFEDESVVFKKSSKTAIHQRFMSVNNVGEQESLQLYRRLFKLNFNKNTRDLFRVLENVVEENKDTMKESDETDEEETLQTLFSKSTGTSYATIPPLSQAQKVKDHQIVWARKKLRAHSKVTQLRTELKEPLNYWKWKAKCDAEQAMQKHLADQYNADVSVQLRHGKETALVEQSNYVNLEQRESLAHMHQMVTDMVDNLPIMSPSMALLYENAQRPFTSKLSTRDMLDDLSMYSHMKAWPPRGTSLNLGKQSEKQELRQEEMQSALVRVINQSDNSFAKVGPFESESHQEFE